MSLNPRWSKLKNALSDLTTAAQKAGAFGTAVGPVVVSSFLPFFIVHPGTRYFAVFGALAGGVGGTLVGLNVRHRAKTTLDHQLRLFGPVALAIVALLLWILVLVIADGSLPNAYPWLTPIYNLFFAAPLLADAILGVFYAIFWGAVASLIRLLP